MNKWVLIETEDNEILEPDTYNTWTEAYTEMKKRYEEIFDQCFYCGCHEGEARIQHDYAFVDHDSIRIAWRIYEVK